MHVYDNSTRNNLMIHYQFSNATVPQKNDKSYYNEDFNSTELVVNRTDSNMQYFNLTFGDDF
jgi:hypothetical protein